MSVYDLPHLNAALNTLAAMLIFMGWVFIKNDQKTAHRNAMILAVLVSAAFLTSYLVFHYHVGSVKYTGSGVVKYLYYAVLLTHVVLAAVVPVLVFITIYRAARKQFDKHKRIARWTLPIWMYVSVTGVVVYMMLRSVNAYG